MFSDMLRKEVILVICAVPSIRKRARSRHRLELRAPSFVMSSPGCARNAATGLEYGRPPPGMRTVGRPPRPCPWNTSVGCPWHTCRVGHHGPRLRFTVKVRHERRGKACLHPAGRGARGAMIGFIEDEGTMKPACHAVVPTTPRRCGCRDEGGTPGPWPPFGGPTAPKAHLTITRISESIAPIMSETYSIVAILLVAVAVFRVLELRLLVLRYATVGSMQRA